LKASELEQWLGLVEPHVQALGQEYQSGSNALLRVPEWRDDIDEARAALERLSQGARTMVFFGTGGSSLGGQTLAQLGGWFIPGEQRPNQLQRPRNRFYDNLDPRTFERTLNSLDLPSTRFVVISKSGTTAETLAQFLTALQAVKAAGLEDKIPELFLGLTMNTRNGLRQICEAHGIPLLEHEPSIPGRYSVLTNVGMLAAMARGLDAVALRQGAGRVVEALSEAANPKAFAPALGAAVAVAMMKQRGIRAMVMLPYSDRLERFAHWYAQLWGESLGKGGEGSTPVPALGPVDQHSLLQLLLDGPRDYLVTTIRYDNAGIGPEIDPSLARQAGAPYLGGRTVGDLVEAQQRAIPEALTNAGRPVRTVDFEALDEEILGSLLMHFMIETILAARLLDVDPFDQPAVEEGKRLTQRYLGGDQPERQEEKQDGHSPAAAVDR
jgi:glucose-6-phosphate isomerase